MLSTVHVRNLLSFRDARVSLEPLTVLVGPNGSGKSNLFHVIDGLKEPNTGWIEDARSKDAGDGPVEVELVTREPALQYGAVVSPDGSVARERLSEGGLQLFDRNPEGGFNRPVGLSLRLSPQVLALHVMAHQGERMPTQALKLSTLLKGVRVFDFDPLVLRQPSTVTSTLQMGRRGEGLAAVLYTLREEHPADWSHLHQALLRCVPAINLLSLPSNEPGKVGVAFHERSGLIDAGGASDGTMMLLALLTLIHLPGPPAVVCIEEPERGIHPRRLSDLVDYLWELSNRGVQVLAATHSPYFIDCFRERRESVVIVEMTPQGTRFQRLSDLTLRPEELDAPLGEIWFSGVLGGVPTHR